MRRMIAIVALMVGIVACGGTAPSSPDPRSVAIAQQSPDGSAPAGSPAAMSSIATPTVRPTAQPSAAPTKASAGPTTGPRPAFAVGDQVVTVTDHLRVRSQPGVSADSRKYEPPLEAGTNLRILRGPVAASGFWWYRVGLPDGMTLEHGIADGWVAASDHDGTAWIAETDGLPGPDTEDPAMAIPVAVMGAAEPYVDGLGATYIRHEMSISNWADYPPALFTSRPGEDTCASRTEVEIVDVGAENSVMVFCGFTKPGDLLGIWFGTAAGFTPPRWVSVELNDSELGTSVGSDPVEVCPLAFGPGCTK